ncbi:glyoxylase-like metal-dependent hydrolase (beta-lactamase superfamily II) [Psychromicrobium silvestre]|uniref:Glyoxylase-like metal-dependent hydrolase (Beta-lactamase superfamily II) n=1 Tax=Psychromicrobium silvestre TaxID=1645614 RepID=A0A7Y9LV07_9MICC|nr:N-acyl homoserine lactonase family protein [Psychromicrobium silvestre]NYE96118.1 glyoxylase-like metal-dependent hydrolase (beta-lactamase superfamily II) [Psychromicrobium silvestre]
MQSIKRVSVVSTGSVEIHPEHVARTRAPELWWLMTSRRWTAPRPINVYVIEHESGLVLFDTGQDRASVTDKNYFPGGLIGVIYSRLARFSIKADETLSAQLAKIGYDIADVKTVVISHLHQDHIGGLAELAHAEIIVGAAEIASAREKRPETRGYLTNHIFIPGLRWKPLEGELDLFDDGALTIIPTPGHTPGSLSMLAKQDGMTPLLFVGDLTYDVSLLEKGHVPGVGDKAGLEASTEQVTQLAVQHPGLVVLAAHDPAAAGLLGAAQTESPVTE